MRISELSRVTGVPTATVKFYLREGLLHEGRRTAATRATYDASHVARLGLVRALLGPGGLSVATTRELLGQVDRPAAVDTGLLAAAHRAVTRPGRPAADPARLHTLLRRWGWAETGDPAVLGALAAALEAVDAAGFDLPEATLDTYARAMREVAEVEIAQLPGGSPEAAVRYVVLGTVLMEPVLLLLRRLAEQQASVRRFGDPAD